MKPEDALSPLGRLEPGTLNVIYTSPDGAWSLARMVWDGAPRLGCRWNGDINNPADKGNPSSRGHGTWFILPDELVPVVMESIKNLPQVHAYA